jgi:hypothetical protein
MLMIKIGDEFSRYFHALDKLLVSLSLSLPPSLSLSLPLFSKSDHYLFCTVIVAI